MVAGVFGFVFAADAFLLALVWRNETATRLQAIAGGLAFAFLSIWTAGRLTDELLPWGLGAYLAFAVLHTAVPVLLQRTRGDATLGAWGQLYPPLALLLLLGPLLKSDDVSAWYWPAVLLVGVVAVVVALVSGSVGALGVVLVFTLGAMGVSIFKVTGADGEFGSLLWLIAGFSLFFFAAGLFIARRFGSRLANQASGTASQFFGNTAAQIPAFSALLPFALLIMMSQRLQILDPAPLFGLALLLCALVLGLTRLLKIEWLALCALLGTAALEYAWHARYFDAGTAISPLLWYAGFYGLFAAFPFLFRRTFSETTGPWAVAALGGVIHFPIIYSVVRQAWPEIPAGLIPAAFAVAPLLVDLSSVGRREPGYGSQQRGLSRAGSA